jgi:hypothetical protein
MDVMLNGHSSNYNSMKVCFAYLGFLLEEMPRKRKTRFVLLSYADVVKQLRQRMRAPQRHAL